MSSNRKESDGAARFGQQFNIKTAKVLGLFMAVVLAATPGCGTTQTARPGHVHVDRNGDGYCDEDGETITGGGSGGSHYYHSNGGYYSTTHYGGSSSSPVTTSTHSAGITSGAHGGIGGHSSGGGG